MSYSCLILGDSGTGKTCSLRNLDPAKCLLIQPVRKPLPFRNLGWKERKEKGDGGNVFVTTNTLYMLEAMKRATADIIIVDDFQYILSFQYMQRRNEKSFDKFLDIGGAGFDICKLASELAENKRVYVLAHTHTEDGRTRIKTLGKLLDDKIVLEGMFTTVLRTAVDGDNYLFSTHNSGSDTVKSPMGMFSEHFIENDLAAVDRTICEFYGIETAPSHTSLTNKRIENA